MQRRSFIAAGACGLLVPSVHAHHGWSGFDQDRPIYLEGQADSVAWRNPHAELQLRVAPDLKLPPDLATRPVPAQSTTVDAPRILKSAQLPRRKDAVWEIELAPLTRMEAWKVAPLKAGDRIAVIGYTFAGEKGEAILRAEYLFVGNLAYGLRSSPA
jgi:uncharacterized protein DUF6152